jgi:hypothetical protein
MTDRGKVLLIVGLVSIAAILGSDSDFIRAQPGAKSITKSVEEDRGVFYRLKVNLTYKGEPQNFDIVVGCNVRQINYADGGRTVEIGLVPTVFGRRMSDGKGLVVRPPRACRGETTENGQVQPDLLPVVIVYENADILDFGTAYLSEDAYESPLSVLKFGGATIERAIRSEFDEFRKMQTNLVPREAYHAALGSGPRVPRPFGHSCQAHQRFRIPEELSPLVRDQWPEGKPAYWVPDTFEAEQRITGAIHRSKALHSDMTTDPALPWSAWRERWNAADFGLPTRTGGGRISARRGYLFPAAYYPSSDDRRTDKWPSNHHERAEYLAALKNFAWTSIDVGGGRMRGFGYCFTGIGISQQMGEMIRSKILNRVDGEPVLEKRGTRGTWIFEGNEYVFRFFRTYLESTRGDV